MIDPLDDSIAKLGATIDAKVADFAQLRKDRDDLLCSAKIAVYFMDQARTPGEMKLAVGTLKDAIAKAEKGAA